EDLAYFGMDFRRDISTPGKPPYQVSVANYTKNYVLLISSSKAFSYAGQRMAITCVSDEIYNKSYPYLKERFGTDKYGYTLVLRIIYSLSSGATHSTQYAFAAMLKAANEGHFNFVENVKEYGKRAEIMKKLFTDAGFKIVYNKDVDLELADGFYFTIQYPNMSGDKLLRELLLYGISAISLDNTGSEHKDALRACVSQISLNMMDMLQERLDQFKNDHI
ncbi:MAG TPA: aminotransferase class I/II-fold pyridoxal phosphate-dependent enzyme, partial [Bacteroidales bacterium]|nr:aminotransferase class I/II-fold pyridoxal phosphate-dependent enzyme [Bacteroidales bacterium]